MIDRILCLVFGSPRFRRLLFVPLFFALLLVASWSTESWDAPYSASGARPVDPAVLAIAPKGVHIVVDTARNRLYLKNGKTLLLEAVCSTGNGKILNDPAKNRSWRFDTPRGEFHILKKVHRPVWTKPDWAFIEEGEQVPSSFRERVEEDMLGDYALHIGNSYLIHGTLYRRLLGRSVTHGCVRLGDADLEKVFKASAVGTPVFIF